LFPTETQQYDATLLRELLNNCIAHQDYTIGGRIYRDEFEDMVVISNPGTFLPGDIQEVLKPGYTAPYYRNQLLADAMAKFNMIDTVQMGIRKVFNIQRNRYFPMPDYDLGMSQKVAVKVYGKVLDENYTRVLFERPGLDIEDVFLIDRVQKKLSLTKEQYKRLRNLGVIEGKIPNTFVSATIAEMIDEKAQYIKNKGQSEQYYKQMIIDYLNQWGKSTKSEFIELLGDKLPNVLNEKQKANKVRNYLTSMRQVGIIKRAEGNQRTGVWVLAKND
jgi:ATP-dependent DNA helicase RecG